MIAHRHPGVRRRDHARAAVSRPPRPGADAVLLDRRDPRPSTCSASCWRRSCRCCSLTLVPVAFPLRRQRAVRRPPGRLRPAITRATSARIVVGGVGHRRVLRLVGLAVASLTSRRAFAIGGYLALMTMPTIVGGVLGHALNHGTTSACWRSRPRRSRWRQSLYPGLHVAGISGPGGVGDRPDRRDRRQPGVSSSALPGGRGMSEHDAPAIVFDRVSRWYGDTVALADVSFTVGPGVTGLLGHNGAGKSTALRLCGGFATPSAGTVRVLGVDPRRDAGRLPADRHRARPQSAVAVPDRPRGRRAVRAPARRRRPRAPPRSGARRPSTWATSPTARWAASPTACASA